MDMHTTSHNRFFTRCYRLWQLVVWLMITAKRIYGLKHQDSAQRNRMLQRIAADMLAIVRLRLVVEQPPQHAAKPPMLVVSNHISWLDIFVLMTQYPSGFIAKESIRRWPLIGTLASRIGTVFINRNSRQDVAPVIHAIVNALTQQQSVTFFPEARTSDGQGVLPFKAALFQAAIDSAAPVQAIALRYYDAQGQRTTAVSYVGHTNLFVSLWRIVGISSMTVKVNYAPAINAAATQQADRFQLKTMAEEFIGGVVNEHTEAGNQ